MAAKRKIYRVLLTTLWVSLSIGIIVLLVAAVSKEHKQKCTGLDISIKGVNNNFFVDKSDILAAINQYIDGSPVGQPMSLLDLKSLEADLSKNIWIRKCQLFFDNNAMLHVNISEREPVARVFTSNGNSFYIDSSLAMLPLSDKLSARLPVFTNFPSDKKVLLRKDSALLREVHEVATLIHQDEFLMALIDQIDITADRTFEMIPKLGNNIIAFGNAENAAAKFNKLKLFYKEVMVKSGWNKYSVVDVQYKSQVVARRKDAKEIATDSLKTIQLMQLIAENAERMASDSMQVMMQDNENNTTNESMILQSVERDDPDSNLHTLNLKPQGIPVTGNAVLPNSQPMKNPGNNAAVKKTAVTKPVLTAKATPTAKPAATYKQVNKTVAAKPVTKAVTKPQANKPVVSNKPKPVTKPAAKPAQKPKAVMPAKNDY